MHTLQDKLGQVPTRAKSTHVSNINSCGMPKKDVYYDSEHIIDTLYTALSLYTVTRMFHYDMTPSE